MSRLSSDQCALPDTSMKSSLPTITTCLELMDRYEMLANIREHSFAVALVAETVLNRLEHGGNKEILPPKNLVIAGALLHDIAKTECIANGGDHSRIGSEICNQLGYHEVGEIVKEHVWLVEFVTDRYKKGIFLAKELIYYADKRVLHDKIVSLSARLDYILERYGNNDPARHTLIRKNFSQCQELEKWLCQCAGCSVSTLLDDISTRSYLKQG